VLPENLGDWYVRHVRAGAVQEPSYQIFYIEGSMSRAAAGSLVPLSDLLKPDTDPFEDRDKLLGVALDKLGSELNGMAGDRVE